MQEQLTGTGVAIVTPFKGDGSIDFPSLGKLLEHIIGNKVDFVVGLGTTSEAATLSAEEKLKVMSFVKQNAGGRVPVVMGIGGNDTARVVEEVKKADYEGISAILSVAPYYNKPNQRGMHAHFSAIAKACPVDIILYNVPSRTSSNIAAKTILALAKEHENIVAVKEASGDLSQISEIIQDRSPGFKVLSGDDALTLPMMALGSDGVISVVANAFPAPFSQMVRLMKAQKVEEARKIHFSLLKIIDLMFEDGNPAGVKAALSFMDICQNYLRLPLVPVNESVALGVHDIIQNYQYKF